MDVFLERPMQPREFIRELSEQLPDGIKISAAQEVGLALPSMQADMQFAEYAVDVPADAAIDVPVAVEQFLAAETIAWEHKRENETRSYDIRAQVESITILADDGSRTTLAMRLKNDNSGSGRPEQVVAAIGLSPPTRIHRTKLILVSQSKALDAWRKSGRPEG